MVARELDATLIAIKCELGAILIFALIGAPLAIYLLDGVLEWVLLGGYGVGAVLWIHARLRGLKLAALRAETRSETRDEHLGP